MFTLKKDPPEGHYASELEVEFLFDAIKSEGCTKLLEIGSKTGRMLWRWGNFLPEGSMICSIDLPGNEEKSVKQNLEAVISHLCEKGFDAHLNFGNSRDKTSIEWAREHGPYDLIFIDADHSQNGVKADWENYHEMSRLVAFHDINPSLHKDIAKLYKEVCKKRRHIEFIEFDLTPGIGIVWT